ncbi:MAG: Gfo/Idh/MocA family oxidoreductase [Chloroflexi bacterium]|nr:Gfo/Idh/MocA family oxidoreductase [Chloroflexota bacterium]
MIRIAIVGTGGMGTVHYHNYAHIPGCQVAALVGITEQSRQSAAEWGLPLYPDIASMARAQSVDVVDVCTPTFMHKEHVTQALSLGLHAITEKPVALRAQDAREMFDLAERQGKLLLVAQVLQFTKEIEILRGLVRGGEYGKPLDAHFERLAAAPRWSQNGWLFDREKSGLLPLDLHIHDLDIIVSLFGRPERVSFTSCGGADKAYKEHYRFLYGYPTLNVSAEAAWFNADFPFTARWRVYFEQAVLVNEAGSLTAYAFDHPPRVFDTADEIQIPTGINLPPTGMFYRELSHFVDCVRRGEPSERVGREQIMTVIELLEEMTAGD